MLSFIISAQLWGDRPAPDADSLLFAPSTANYWVSHAIPTQPPSPPAADPIKLPVAPVKPVPRAVPLAGVLRAASAESEAPIADPEPPLEDGAALDQITSISSLSDVQPTDWAFQALRSLVERYGCIVGYPDKTFRGNRALTRYEFAAGLNSCLDKVQELLSAATADLATRDDLETLKKLQEDFAAELALLRGRVDALDVRTAQLEKQQFSTTVTLQGQVVFGLADAFGGEPPGLGETNAVFTYLTQLQFTSSFTGRDLLRINLASANFANEGFGGFRSLNTYMALLNYQGDLSNRLELNGLDYRIAVSDRLVVAIQPVGFSLYSVLSPNSSYLDAGTGAVSRFAALNPILRIGNLDAGVGFDWLISDRWRLQGAYGARTATDPTEGLFGSGHQAFGLQFLHKPNQNVILGFAYINSFSDNGQLDTFVGSSNADLSGGFGEPAQIHALAASLRWRLSPTVTVGVWGGAILTDATFGKVFKAITDRDINVDDFGAVTLSTTYLFSVGIQDPFGRQGDQLVFMVGQPPKLQAGVLIERVDEGNSFHFESFYSFRISDHIAISPGFFYVTNPGNIDRNNSIFVGTIRATFNF